MPRRYYRRRTSGNRDKYSVENTIIEFTSTGSWDFIEGTSTTRGSFQTKAPIIPPTDLQGMRKIKHITLSFSSNGDDRIFYALVYVPGGYEPNILNLPTLGQPGSLYEPNQYVMSAGVLDFSGGPLRIRTPLARNLNSDDSIYIVLAVEVGGGGVMLSMNASYAITLQ